MGDRRALLEAIAFGNDPDVKPPDRLRALEMLNELDPERVDLNDAFRAELAGLDGAALDAQLDAVLGPQIVRDALAGGDRFPIMARLIQGAVEVRARELAPVRVSSEPNPSRSNRGGDPRMGSGANSQRPSK